MDAIHASNDKTRTGTVRDRKKAMKGDAARTSELSCVPFLLRGVQPHPNVADIGPGLDAVALGIGQNRRQHNSSWSDVGTADKQSVFVPIT